MKNSGFGFVEIFLIVVGIIIIFLLIPNISNGNSAKHILTTKTIIKSLETPLTEYSKKHPNRRYPEASEEEKGNGTSVLVKELEEGNFYKFKISCLTEDKPHQLVDGWGRPMRYHPWRGRKIKDYGHNKKSYDLWSAGADGDFATEEDNVTNWATILENDE